MVLESLFPARKIINKPLDMLILSIIISAASVFLAQFIFPGPAAGKIITLFVTIGMTPVIYRIFRIEEEIEREEAEHKINEKFWDRHGETVILFALFFIGNFISIFLITLIMPDVFVKDVFQDQLSEISRISNIGGSFAASSFTELILFNNLRVMTLSFLLSFLIGTGALVVLSWNASILALYLASFVKQGLFEEFLIRGLSIAPHVPIEIGAYFLAGIAGGILSVGVIREKLHSKEFILVFRDSVLLLGLGILAVIVGAYVEVYL